MKIISWNVNGLRSIYKKGFLELLEKESFDIVCLQEIKVKMDQLTFDFLEPAGYHSIYNSAKRPGYSGVAVFSKIKPRKIEKSLGFERFDDEGRILSLDYEDFLLLNVYIPHGARDKRNLNYKLKVYKYLNKKIKRIRDKNTVLLGDFNIAHKDIDLARPDGNRNNIMFTKKERNQIDKIIDLGFADSFRKFNKKSGNYSWWPYRFEARKKNVGWRIDYVFVSKGLLPRLKDAFILRKIEGSDHCPIGVEIA
jgi:exodeoxyribonuclease-3